MQHAKLLLMKIIQREEFHEGTVLEESVEIYPLVDKEGLLRAKTLVFRSKDINDFCSPIILPGITSLCEN